MSEVLIPVLLAGAFVFVTALLFLTGHCERLLDAGPAQPARVAEDRPATPSAPAAVVEALVGETDGALTGIA